MREIRPPLLFYDAPSLKISAKSTLIFDKTELFKTTKSGIYFVPSEELEPHLKDTTELIKHSNSISIKM